MCGCICHFYFSFGEGCDWDVAPRDIYFGVISVSIIFDYRASPQKIARILLHNKRLKYVLKWFAYFLHEKFYELMEPRTNVF